MTRDNMVDFRPRKNENTNMYRRKLKKTLDLKVREKAQNTFRSLQKYKTAIRIAKEDIWKKYVKENINKES